MQTKAKRAVFLQELQLTNVKSFKGEHRLDLTDPRGNPARWTLILGENGVGKTTLLECLAHLTPRFNSDTSDGEKDPLLFVEPALAAADNDVIFALGRQGDGQFVVAADYAVDTMLGRRSDNDEIVQSSVSFRREDGEVKDLVPSRWRYSDAIPQSKWNEASRFREPLVLAYGAGRYMGHANLDLAKVSGDTDSLLHGKVELFDAEELLMHYDYRAFRPGTKRDKRQKEQLLELLAAILPEVEDSHSIAFLGAPTPGSAPGGVHVRTRDGLVPLKQLSFGYKTMMAWALDIALRLFNHHPDSTAPFAEPVIILIDEIDLHLHPRWQRELRGLLTTWFPNAQFVATAHSPLMAQAYLDANIAVVTRDGDHSVIENDPHVVENWRLDEIVTSDLYGFRSAFPPEVDALFEEQRRLASMRRLDNAQETRLQAIESELLALPTGNVGNDAAWDTVRRFADLLERHDRR